MSRPLGFLRDTFIKYHRYSNFTSRFNCSRLSFLRNSILNESLITSHNKTQSLMAQFNSLTSRPSTSSINNITSTLCNQENYSYSRKSCNYMYPLLGFSIFGIQITGDNEEEEEEEKESALVMMIKRGILAMQRDELDKAEQLFHIALKTAQEQQETQGITYIYDLMANLAYQQEDFKKAEKLFKDVIQRLLAGGMEQEDNAIIEISLKLASIYANTGEIEKAATGFLYCIAAQEKKISTIGIDNLDEDSLLLWAMSMDWYARLLIRLGKYDLAKEHFIKAYEMSVKVNGSLHDQSAVLLNDIGSVCSLMKDYEQAVDYLNKAIQVAKETDNPDITVFYINLGILHMERQLFDEANKSCMQGLTLAKSSNNEDAIHEATKCIDQVELFKKQLKVQVKT